MPGFPSFPRRGEPWAACYFCGFAYPVSELTRHYKNKRLVCDNDADIPTHSDNQEYFERPQEHTDPSPQRVPTNHDEDVASGL